MDDQSASVGLGASISPTARMRLKAMAALKGVPIGTILTDIINGAADSMGMPPIAEASPEAIKEANQNE